MHGGYSEANFDDKGDDNTLKVESVKKGISDEQRRKMIMGSSPRKGNKKIIKLDDDGRQDANLTAEHLKEAEAAKSAQEEATRLAKEKQELEERAKADKEELERLE